MRGGKEPVARNAGVGDAQRGVRKFCSKFLHGHDADMRGVVVEVQSKCSARAWQVNGLWMRRLEVGEAAGLEQSRDLREQIGQRVEVFDDVHAGDHVHRMVGPRKFVGGEIESAEVARGGIFFRVTELVGGMKSEIGAELGDVIERFAIGRTEIKQRAVHRSPRDVRGSCVQRWKSAQVFPVHLLERRAVE